MITEVKFKLLYPEWQSPHYLGDEEDIPLLSTVAKSINPNEYAVIHTGLIIQQPPGIRALIQGSFSLAEQGVLIYAQSLKLQKPTELKCVIYNLSTIRKTFKVGDLLGNLNFISYVHISPRIVTTLDDLNA